jgi:hypothetical protein
MIYLIDLEPVETRYTAQWKQHLPKKIEQKTGQEVRVISGGETPQMTTPGAFLNFAGTNVYKSQQAIQIAELFARDLVKDGDHFVYTDAWNPTIIQLQYMRELLNKKIKIHALWHAGSYDPHDFLGRLIQDKTWSYSFEIALYSAIDHNYFASNFHIDMFKQNLKISDVPKDKIIRSGWPMEYMEDTLTPFKNMEKRKSILFPHRIAPEKNPEIFEELKLLLPEYEFIMCQQQTLTKDEYHNMLGEAALVFSANTQETLGISCYEALCVGTLPIVPDRLSYMEMYPGQMKYPSDWAVNKKSFKKFAKVMKERLISGINFAKSNEGKNLMQKTQQFLAKEYFSANKLYEKLID